MPLNNPYAYLTGPTGPAASASGGFGLSESFGAPDVTTAFDNVGDAGSKSSSSFADFGNWAAGAQALGSLIQGWGGLKAASAAKEQNRIAELFGRANYDVQAKGFNERLETRARSRRNRESFDSGGKSIADVLSQYGARTLEGGSVVGQDPAPSAPAPAPVVAREQAQVLDTVDASPTAGLPAPQRRPRQL